MDWDKFKWVRWYEEFAGDWYWQGPEFRQTVPAGTYTIIVYNTDNNWDKYVLATGEIESFQISKYPDTEKQIYAIKTEFFDQSWYAIFAGQIGRYQLLLVILLLGLFFSGGRVTKLLRREK